MYAMRTQPNDTLCNAVQQPGPSTAHLGCGCCRLQGPAHDPGPEPAAREHARPPAVQAQVVQREGVALCWGEAGQAYRFSR